MDTPILYSFRRCPYCMRAHMAIKKAGLDVEIREVRLSDIPEEALKASSKTAEETTVPILILSDGTVFDESWDILKWALQQNDPDNWLGKDGLFIAEAEMLIELNDFSFKNDLDHYKYADRFPEQTEEEYRLECEEFIEELEETLVDNRYLLGERLSLADIGVFPFVRQFSMVDQNWFNQSKYKYVRNWLNELTGSELFQHVFKKQEIWVPGNKPIYV